LILPEQLAGLGDTPVLELGPGQVFFVFGSVRNGKAVTRRSAKGVGKAAWLCKRLKSVAFRSWFGGLFATFARNRVVIRDKGVTSNVPDTWMH
jgi:hypothetical protein